VHPASALQQVTQLAASMADARSQLLPKTFAQVWLVLGTVAQSVSGAWAQSHSERLGTVTQ